MTLPSIAASVSGNVPPSAEMTSMEHGNGGSRLSADRTVSLGVIGYTLQISAEAATGVRRQQTGHIAAHQRAYRA